MQLRITTVLTMALLGHGLALTGDRAEAQQTLASQLIGAWTLISADTVTGQGVKIPYLEGANIKGLLVFTAKSYSMQIISELPKLASNDRLKTTPEEDRAIAHGVLVNWGTYTVNEADKVLTLQNERSSFPNQNGAVGTRNINHISSTELRFSVPTTRTGNSQILIWQRLE